MIDFLIFGTGSACEKMLLELDRSKVNIKGFFDNDRRKYGKRFNGFCIDLPQNINKYQFEYILIASTYYKEIKQQLINMNIDKEKILSWYYYNDDQEYNIKHNVSILNDLCIPNSYYFVENGKKLEKCREKIENNINKISNIDKFSKTDKEFYNKNYYNISKKENTFLEGSTDIMYNINLVNKVLENISYIKGPTDTLLDVGCAIGYFTEAFRINGFDSTGIDYSEIGIKEGEKMFPKCRFKVMNAFNPEFKDEKFNIILMRGLTILLHNHDIDFIAEFLDKYEPYIKENGVMIVAFYSNFTGLESKNETINLSKEEMYEIVNKSKFKLDKIFFPEEEINSIRKFNEKKMVYISLRRN